MTVDESSQQAALQRYLLDGERILWTGQPDPRRLLSASDAIVIPFSLMWGGFALFWEAGVLGFLSDTPGPGSLFALWGIPFVVIGQYFIWGRFFYKRWDRRRTIYAVTSQRILVVKGSNVQSLFVKQLPQLNQSVRADGSGTIEFGANPYGFGFWGNTGMEFLSRRSLAPAFYDIPEVDRVSRVITDARSPSF